MELINNEFKFLEDSVGLMVSPEFSIVEHQGPDTLDLLNRISTADLTNLSVHHVQPTVLTSPKGRVVDLFYVLRIDVNRLMLISDYPPPAPLIEGIQRYTIIEEAELFDISDNMSRIVLIGFGIPQLLGSVFDLPYIKNGGMLSGSNEGIEIIGFRWDWPLLQRMDIIVSKTDLVETVNTLKAGGALQIDSNVFDALRIVNGVPISGKELTTDFNPLELGLKDLISFSKGCYVGQEVIARLTTYDKVRRRLMRFSSVELIDEGAVLKSNGKKAGMVTSVAGRLDKPGVVGLALIGRTFWDGQVEQCAINDSIQIFSLPERC